MDKNQKWVALTLILLLVVIVVFLITTPSSNPEESFGYGPEYVVLIGQFSDRYFWPMCGIDHHPGVSYFTNVITSDGRLIEGTIEVMHDCDFIMLGYYTENRNSSELLEGRYYRLEVVVIRAFAQNWGWFEKWEWELGDKPPMPKTLYYCHRAELITQNAHNGR